MQIVYADPLGQAEITLFDVSFAACPSCMSTELQCTGRTFGMIIGHYKIAQDFSKSFSPPTSSPHQPALQVRLLEGDRQECATVPATKAWLCLLALRGAKRRAAWNPRIHSLVRSKHAQKALICGENADRADLWC